MRRLGLILLVLAILVQGACAESEYPDVFWDGLTCGEKGVVYDNEELEARSLSKDWYVVYKELSQEERSLMEWRGIPFSDLETPPNNNSFWHGGLWEIYFNEMYYLGGRSVQKDENGYSPFWDGLLFCGEPVDPYTAPPNYDAEMDYWREVREIIGYAWYWSYWFCDYKTYVDRDLNESTWSWNGTDFNMREEPPNYPHYEVAAKVDPFYDSRLFSGYLEYWEEYFNAQYYESLSE